MELAFDRVIISDGGARRELTVEQFLGLPLDVRIQLVLARAVEFYRGFAPIDVKIALNSLRKTSTNGG
jgi:hypothetical protein